MKVGILSDTHGQVDMAMSAAREFINRDIQAVFHCGDIGDEMVLTEMACIFDTLQIPVYAVLGNCDIPADWGFYPEDIGVKVLGRFGEVELFDKKIALVHSDDEACYKEAAEADRYDYLFSGHTHVRHDYHIKRTHLINPGATGRGMHPSCAVLDLATDTVEFMIVHRPHE